MNILVGDIGGTHCRLALANFQQGALASHPGRAQLRQVQRFANARHDSLTTLLQHYLAQLGPAGLAPPDIACLAVAGPTDGRHVHFTNLDWRIDSQELETRLGIPRVLLINDFAAVVWGLNGLAPDDLEPLQDGSQDATGVKAAVGAGTGLGVGLGTWRDGLHHPIATEGGHIGFAPTDARQDRLLQFMRALHGRVSVERLLSGPGILDLYRFCSDEAGTAPRLLDSDRPGEAISQAALGGDDAAAAQALRLFTRIYGQVAGDIALATGARGGLYLAGGIAPQILPLFKAPDFLAGLQDKGRFRNWMAGIPVSVILDPDIGLRGAGVAGLWWQKMKTA